MSKYIKLIFKDASIFPKLKKDDFFLKQFETKDQVLLPGKHKYNTKIRFSREDIPFYKEYITVYHISNVIHSLFGERPVPKNRKVIYPIIDKYFKMSENSYLKIYEYIENNIGDKISLRSTGKSGEITKKINDEIFEIKIGRELIKVSSSDIIPNLHVDTIQVKKPFNDSWNPNVVVTWLLIKDYIGDELFTEFISLLKLLDINTETTLLKAITEIREKVINNEEYKKFEEKLKFNKKSNLILYINGRNDTNGNLIYPNLFSMAKETTHCVNTAISKSLKLSGEIIIPVENLDIDKLRNSKGSATILDGGIVYIKGIIQEHNFNEDRIFIEGFKKVKDISTETY